ncbi:DUF1501 domain-containing protein [Achromobacter insuavis]
MRADRREFLLRACALGASHAAAPLVLNLAALGAAAAQSAPPGDYKALVCVFLYGGNDPFNTLVPFDPAAYRAYAAARTDIALPREALQATALRGATPAAGGAVRAGPIAGAAGAAVRARRDGGGAERRPAGDAHQQGGLHRRARAAAAQAVLAQRPAVVLAGAGAGRRFLRLGRPPDGSVRRHQRAAQLHRHHRRRQHRAAGGPPRRGLPGRRERLDPHRAADARHVWLQRLHRAVAPADHATARAPDGTRDVAHRGAVDRRRRAAPDGPVGRGGAGRFRLAAGQQLKIVARIIAARQALGARRQVFFVSQNGYDNHTGLNDTHPALLKELGQALAVFQAALAGLGVARQVTTFTASEFGRTLGSNGNGSDHGWGAHHFVLGGAVNGGRYHGAHPEIAPDGPGFVDNGRLLPTLAVEQLGAALGGWFGASADDLRLVFPNLRHFDAAPLALFTAPRGSSTPGAST